MVNMVLKTQAAQAAMQAVSAAGTAIWAVLTAALGPTGAAIAGVAALFGLGKMFGGGGAPKKTTFEYRGGVPAAPDTGAEALTTAATAAQATKILSVVIRVEEGAVQLSPRTFDAATARDAVASLWDELKRKFETEDLAEGMAQA
jgi:hypothetical protein